jgi:hypothetical protein
MKKMKWSADETNMLQQMRKVCPGGRWTGTLETDYYERKKVAGLIATPPSKDARSGAALLSRWNYTGRKSQANKRRVKC